MDLQGRITEENRKWWARGQHRARASGRRLADELELGPSLGPLEVDLRD
jgi:hypothetical protein